MDFSSKLLENAVNEMSRLPGIGKRTALRLVLHLLKQPKENTTYLSEAILHLRNDVKNCEKCHNISDTVLCVLSVIIPSEILTLFALLRILEM